MISDSGLGLMGDSLNGVGFRWLGMWFRYRLSWFDSSFVDSLLLLFMLILICRCGCVCFRLCMMGSIRFSEGFEIEFRCIELMWF